MALLQLHRHKYAKHRLTAVLKIQVLLVTTVKNGGLRQHDNELNQFCMVSFSSADAVGWEPHYHLPTVMQCYQEY